LPPVIIDAASVSQVVFTLLDNAAKYSPPGSVIRLTASRTTTEAVRIVVEDQGSGIPKPVREKVFDKFVRLDGDAITGSGSGLGLGLAIARGIIESQNGRIWIEDGSKGFVTRVVCELPARPAGQGRTAVAK
jgi:two-component system, OmpR family, sensor histidine kinase KdpD